MILAAGAGTRFGAQKLLAKFCERPLLEHVITNTAASSVDRVVCVLGSDAMSIREVVDLEPAEVVVCDEWRMGQSASLGAGVAALIDASAIVVLLGDEPLVTASVIDRVLEAREPGVTAIRATYKGIPSHPTLIENSLFPDVLELHGDVGARDLLRDAAPKFVQCDDWGSAFDVDTWADLETLERMVRRKDLDDAVSSC